MTGPTRGAWRIILTDLTALLLALVVMMYAMTRVDEERWRALRAHFDLPAILAGVRGIAVPDGGLDGEKVVAPPTAGYLAKLMARQLRAEVARGDLELAEKDEHLIIRMPWRDGQAPTARPPAFAAVVDYLSRMEGNATLILPVANGEDGIEALLHAHQLATAMTRIARRISTVALVRRGNHLSSGGSVEIDLECSRSGS